MRWERPPCEPHRGSHRPVPVRPTSAAPPRACRSSPLACRRASNSERNVQEDPDREPGRDRLPGDQDGAADGDRDRRGLFGRRCARTACENGGRGGAARAAAGVGILSRRRADHRRLQGDRRRGGASRLRLPFRARELRQGAGQGEDRLHRPAAEGDRRDGRQDRIEEAGEGGGGQCRPRPSGRDRGHRRGGADRGGDRLSGDDEGLGRRRRQGHAARL